MAYGRRKLKKNKIFATGGYMDYQTIFLVVVLLAFGVMMVYSASAYRTFEWIFCDASGHYWIGRYRCNDAGFLFKLSVLQAPVDATADCDSDDCLCRYCACTRCIFSWFTALD